MDFAKHLFAELIQAKLKKYILNHQLLNIDQIHFENKNTATIYDLYLNPQEIYPDTFYNHKITNIFTNKLSISINSIGNIVSLYFDNIDIQIALLSSEHNLDINLSYSDISVANIEYLLNSYELTNDSLCNYLDNLFEHFINNVDLYISKLIINFPNNVITINNINWYDTHLINFTNFNCCNFFNIDSSKIYINTQTSIDISKSSYADLNLDSFYQLIIKVELNNINVNQLINLNNFIPFSLSNESHVKLNKIIIITKINNLTININNLSIKINKLKYVTKKLFIDNIYIKIQKINNLSNNNNNNYNLFDIIPFLYQSNLQIKINKLIISIEDKLDSVVIDIEYLKLNITKQYLQIKDLQIIDKVQKSKWNKLLCRDFTKNQSYFKGIITIIKDSNDYFNIFIAPLRLFINQYTVLFLFDWFNQFFNNYTNNNTTQESFIKFKLIEPLLIMLDYKPVRFNTSMSSSDIINLFPLQNLNLKLYPATVNNFEELIEVWKNDIINSGISYKYIKSIMIINSLSLIFSGFTDVFIRPYDNIQKDGLTGLLPGINQGIWSFIEKFINGSCDIVSRITISASSILDTSQHYIYPTAISLSTKSKFSNQPGTLSQGFTDAYNNLIKELKDTGNIVILPFNNQYTISNRLIAVGQSVPILILKPVSASLFSFSKIILGLRNNTCEKQKIIMDQKYS